MWNPFKREIVIKPVINVTTDNTAVLDMLAKIEGHLSKLVKANGPRVINLSLELQERLSQMVRPQ
jgi:hypothetical protein